MTDAPMTDAPVTDLAAFKVQLPAFNGPLDLLYYLIRKHELDISEISLATIADEFAAVVEAAQELNLAVAGNFLVIATTLMYLKSKWLLPPEEEPQDAAGQEGQVGPLLHQLRRNCACILHLQLLNLDPARLPSG